MADLPWLPIADPAVPSLPQRARDRAQPASFVYLYYPWGADLGAAE